MDGLKEAKDRKCLFCRLINWVKQVRAKDPVYSCEVYKKEGCSHVDGFLCDMEKCEILESYKACKIHCPVCGYYCVGKGGFGCIDKPKLTGLGGN